MDPAHVAALQRELRDLILECLGLLGASNREPDPWQSVHMMNAIKALDSGAYALCRRDLQRALWPPSRRTKTLRMAGKPYSLADLRAAYKQLQKS
jgi:hypothetical protein